MGFVMTLSYIYVIIPPPFSMSLSSLASPPHPALPPPIVPASAFTGDGL